MTWLDILIPLLWAAFAVYWQVAFQEAMISARAIHIGLHPPSPTLRAAQPRRATLEGVPLPIAFALHDTTKL